MNADSTSSHFTPLPVLHHPLILSYTILLLNLALILQLPLSEAHLVASEISYRFDLAVNLDMDPETGKGKVIGDDLEEVKQCVDEFLGWCKDGLIDQYLLDHILVSLFDTLPLFVHRDKELVKRWLTRSISPSQK